MNSTKKSSKLSNKSKNSGGLNAPSQTGFPGLQKPVKKPKKTSKKPALNAGPNPLKSGNQNSSPEDFVPTEYQPKWASVNKKGEEIPLDPTPVQVKQSVNWAGGASGGNFPSLAGNSGPKLGFSNSAMKSSNLAKKVAANPKSLLRTAAVPVHIKTRNAKLKQKANQDAKSVRNQNKNQNNTPTNVFPQKIASNANNQRAPQSLIGQSSSSHSNSLKNESRNESKSDFYSAKNDPFKYMVVFKMSCVWVKKNGHLKAFLGQKT